MTYYMHIYFKNCRAHYRCIKPRNAHKYKVYTSIQREYMRCLRTCVLYGQYAYNIGKVSPRAHNGLTLKRYK